jgi:hypothetical protein
MCWWRPKCVWGRGWVERRGSPKVIACSMPCTKYFMAHTTYNTQRISHTRTHTAKVHKRGNARHIAGLHTSRARRCSSVPSSVSSNTEYESELRDCGLLRASSGRSRWAMDATRLVAGATGILPRIQHMQIGPQTVQYTCVPVSETVAVAARPTEKVRRGTVHEHARGKSQESEYNSAAQCANTGLCDMQTPPHRYGTSNPRAATCKHPHTDMAWHGMAWHGTTNPRAHPRTCCAHAVRGPVDWRWAAACLCSGRTVDHWCRADGPRCPHTRGFAPQARPPHTPCA